MGTEGTSLLSAQERGGDLEQGLLSDHAGDNEDRYSGFLGYLLARIQGQPTLEEQEMAREIKCLVGVPFDAENSRHVADLKQFWEFIYPIPAGAASDRGITPSSTSTTSNSTKQIEFPSDRRWKEIGFQSATPATDFRGGGILSLYCMMYLAEKYPAETRQMIAESQKDASCYPFACACINVTVQLIFYLNLQTPEMRYQGTIEPAPVKTKKTVMHVLSESHYQARDAFGELFSNSVMKLHAIWMDMSVARPNGVTMLNFGEALEKNLRALKRTCQGASALDRLEDFAQIMGVDPDTWSTSIATCYSDCCTAASEAMAGAILRVMTYTHGLPYES
eukprot:CAMPEP_0178993432 /NCGR_PEP_ID=MMETSP0795-20121207/6700_1 /TAXON_ID=88552 /ORGANISM="Amoebophrya sp., Strain Ameob2" /LENGTH=334 /DNA_ID=CAMNT_0020685491 /DNA_START=215 /DNA_END=1216 /DNA_ORIENTATION=-